MDGHAGIPTKHYLPQNGDRLDLLLGCSLPIPGLVGKSQEKSQTTIEPDYDHLKLQAALGARWQDVLSRFGAAGGCMLGLG